VAVEFISQQDLIPAKAAANIQGARPGSLPGAELKLHGPSAHVPSATSGTLTRGRSSKKRRSLPSSRTPAPSAACESSHSLSPALPFRSGRLQSQTRTAETGVGSPWRGSVLRRRRERYTTAP